MAKQGFSTRRENAVEGGGGNAAVLKEINWVAEFNYGGQRGLKPNAALRTVYEIEGMDRPWEDHWNVGPSDQFEVSKDGYTIRRVSGPAGLNKASGGYFFFDHLQTALENSGLDIEEYVIEEDGTVNVEPLEGLNIRVTNAPFTNVSGTTKDKKVIAEVIAAPSKKNGSKGSAKSKQSSSDDIEEKTQDAIVALLKSRGTIKKGDLAGQVIAACKKDPDVKAMGNLCFKDAWVGHEDRPWEFNSKRGILTAVEDDE